LGLFGIDARFPDSIGDMVGSDFARLLLGEGGWSDVTGEVGKWLRGDAPGRDSGDLEMECEWWWGSLNGMERVAELDGEVGVAGEFGSVELCDVEAGS
jgi:hypothetical protein